MLAERLRAMKNQPERGAVSLELAIVFPALLVLLLAILQTALWFYARNLALAGANEGARAGAQHATPAAGEDAARSFLAQSAGDALTDVTVSSAGGSVTEVHIRVTGRSLTIVPILHLPRVAQDATAPRERFTTPTRP